MDHGNEAPLIAVDSSGEPLAAAISGDALGKPDLIKPNAEELVELAAAAGFATHKSAEELEADPEGRDGYGIGGGLVDCRDCGARQGSGGGTVGHRLTEAISRGGALAGGEQVAGQRGIAGAYRAHRSDRRVRGQPRAVGRHKHRTLGPERCQHGAHPG